MSIHLFILSVSDEECQRPLTLWQTRKDWFKLNRRESHEQTKQNESCIEWDNALTLIWQNQFEIFFPHLIQMILTNKWLTSYWKWFCLDRFGGGRNHSMRSGWWHCTYSTLHFWWMNVCIFGRIVCVHKLCDVCRFCSNTALSFELWEGCCCCYCHRHRWRRHCSTFAAAITADLN